VRWEYESPEPKSALVLDGRTFVHLPADRQFLRGRLEEDSVLPRLLAGAGRFDEGFGVEDLGPGRRGGTRTLSLVPRGSAGGLVNATVTVRANSGELEEAEIVDAAGNRMLYRFSAWRRNRPLPDGVFSLEPPPGTEVVDLD
jgi:outer membrane lipoprotein-sorting protein